MRLRGGLGGSNKKGDITVKAHLKFQGLHYMNIENSEQKKKKWKKDNEASKDISAID